MWHGHQQAQTLLAAGLPLLQEVADNCLDVAKDCLGIKDRTPPDFQKSVSAALHEPAYRPDTLVRHKQALHLLARTRHLADTGLACPGASPLLDAGGWVAHSLLPYDGCPHEKCKLTTSGCSGALLQPLLHLWRVLLFIGFRHNCPTWK